MRKDRQHTRKGHRIIAGLWLMLALCFIGDSVYAASTSKLFKQGTKAYDAGNYEAALTAYQQASEADPMSAEVQYNLGATYYKLEQFEAAQMAFDISANLSSSPALQRQALYNLGNTLVKSSEALRKEDPYAAMEYGRQAAFYYYAALQSDPSFADAAYNLEICRMITTDIQLEISQQEEQQQQENELIKYIREKLEELIKTQSQLMKQTSEQTWAAAGQMQRPLEDESRALMDVIAGSSLHTEITLPDDTRVRGPLQDTFEHVGLAADAMNRAASGTSFATVSAEQQTAYNELVAALGAAPEDPNKQDGDSEEESEDEEDMEYEDSDDEAEMYEEGDPFGDFTEYEEIRGVPPPNKTETDILKEELENQTRRKQKKAGEYKPVEKDW